MKLVRCYDESLIRSLHEIVFPSDDLPLDYRCCHWVLMDGKDYAGFCILKILPHGIGYLYRAGVMEGYTGKGLQKRMIRCRERLGRKIGLKQMITYTKIHNIASSVNLSKCKYSLYIPEEEYAEEDCLYWIKKL